MFGYLAKYKLLVTLQICGLTLKSMRILTGDFSPLIFFTNLYREAVGNLSQRLSSQQEYGRVSTIISVAAVSMV